MGETCYGVLARYILFYAFLGFILYGFDLYSCLGFFIFFLEIHRIFRKQNNLMFYILFFARIYPKYKCE